MRFERPTIAIATMLVMMTCALFASAQEADSARPGFPTKPDIDQPKTVKEMMEKMRIDQAKKDYDEMLDRGDQAIKISEELERAFSQRRALTRLEIEKLDNLEKLVKKIRGELGGETPEQNADDPDDDPSPNSIADGFKYLQSLTVKLVDELKKTSRFGISAVAIQSTNAVLKVVRFLRFSK